jgi:hypothetical protein
MRLGRRLLLLGGFSLWLLSGCTFDSGMSTASVGDGSGSIAASTGSGSGTGSLASSSAGKTSDNSVVATPSIVGTVSVAAGASETVSVSFTSSDGLPISGFAVSDTTLPQGWSGPDSFSCTTVSTGNGCVLNLTYAPLAVGSGTLTVNYIFVDKAKVPKTPGGSVTLAYVATTHNNVVATAAPTGQIDAGIGASDRSVSVNFTTDDGNAATDLALTTDLSALPSGWSSAARSFSCAIVGMGSGCQLTLNYAPTTPATGTLTLNYSYVDDSGMSESGALNIPYSTTSDGNVVATVAPTGQINAVKKTGSQGVAVTFNTDDDKAAGPLYVTSDLTALPPGWSSVPSFTCTSVSSGNGCQLNLNYAPPALGGGTIILNYVYSNQSGTFKTGSVNVAYAATTNDNVVGLASPTGQINAVVGMGSQAVSVTFTTDDGRPATALELSGSLTALPSGWSSIDSTFTCSGLSSGNGCQLLLTYAPSAAGNGTLVLRYSYKNNAGESKTGSLNIAYRATTDDNVVATASQSPLAVITGSSTGVTVTFATDDGNLASALSVTSGLASLPAGWSSAASVFSCSSVSIGTSCKLALVYAPTAPAAGTLSLGFGYTNDSGTMKSGTAAITYSATP